MAVSPDAEKPYWTDEEAGRHRVRFGAEEIVLTLGDAASAAHYAALLNQAFVRGRRQGDRSSGR